MNPTAEAERAILGGALMEPKTIDDWTITVEDFENPKHREVARELRALHAALETITPLTVYDGLSRRGVGEAVGLDYVSNLLDSQLHTESSVVRHYCGIVLQASITRRLRGEGSSILTDLGTGRIDNAEAMARLQQLTGSVLERMTRQDRFMAMPQLAKAMCAEMDERWNSQRVTGYTTGFPDLDARIGGLRPGVLTILGGRTSTGKSAFARSIADNVTAAGHGVHYFSLEDSALMLAERQFADTAGIDLSVLAHPTHDRMTKGDLAKFTMAANAMRKRSCWGVEDQPQMSSASIAASVRRRKAELGTRVVVVDYVQLIRERGDSPRERINTALTGLLKLAREEQVALLLLSQVGRDQEKESRPPRLSDLKESGAIEEQASCVLLLHRDKDDLKTGAPGKAGVIVAKNKHGARDITVNLRWDGPTATYRSVRNVLGYET